MRYLAILLLLIASLAGCTDQQRAKQFGGTASTTLPACKKLVLITWKNDNLWFLTRDAKLGDTTEKYNFQEDSSFGVMEGTVIITEQITADCFTPQELNHS